MFPRSIALAALAAVATLGVVVVIWIAVTRGGESADPCPEAPPGNASGPAASPSASGEYWTDERMRSAQGAERPDHACP